MEHPVGSTRARRSGSYTQSGSNYNICREKRLVDAQNQVEKMLRSYEFMKNEDVYGTVLPIFQLLGPVRSLRFVQTRTDKLKRYCKIQFTLLRVHRCCKI